MLTREFREAFGKFLSGEIPSFGSVLLTGCVRAYGVDCLEWEPEVFEIQLEEDFRVQLPKRVKDQLMAAVSAVSTDIIYHSVPAWDSFVNAINGDDPQVADEIPSALDLAWAARELLLLDPKPAGRESDPFDPAIHRYCQVVLEDDGFQTPPEALQWVRLTRKANPWMNDASAMEASLGQDRSRAEDIDKAVEDRTEQLLYHLHVLGMDVQKLDLK